MFVVVVGWWMGRSDVDCTYLFIEAAIKSDAQQFDAKYIVSFTQSFHC